MTWTGTSPNRTRGRKWMATIARIKARDKVCVECKRTGKVNVDSLIYQIDHIVSLADGGTDDDGNLQGLCEAHSKHKTASESARKRGAEVPVMKAKRQIGFDGWPT